MEAHERMAEALKDKQRGWRGPSMEKQLVEVFAGDVVQLADVIDNPSPIIQRLREGSAGHAPELRVAIYADHAFELLETARKAKPDGESP